MDRLILPDVNGTDFGAAYLYRFDGATWSYQLLLQGEPGPSCGSGFGRLVALHECTAGHLSFVAWKTMFCRHWRKDSSQ